MRTTKNAASNALWHWPTTRNMLLTLCVLGAAAAAGPVFATATYDAGPLSFTTQDQSMWGSGDAFVENGSKFIGTSWTNDTSKVGSFVGSADATNPAYPVWQVCQDIASAFGGNCAFPKPSRTTNTTTGAEVSLQSSGKFGLNFGYTVDSGSVDAGVVYGATAEVPHTVQRLQYFNLGTNSDLNSGTISTQSPDATASMSLVAQFSGSVSGKGCFVGSCSSSSADLPGVDINQKILALDPDELEILPGLIPNGADDGSVAHVPLGAQDIPITWNESEIGSVSTNVPDVVTQGGLSGSKISSSGSDPLLTATIDVPDLTSLAGFPTNADISVDVPGFDFEAGISPLDINIGPQLSLGQDFDLKPTLMADLVFNRPVQIAGEAAPQTSWEGPWADLPDLALFGTTTFSPTFWLDAPLTNSTDLDLGLVGTYDFLKFEFKLKLGALTLLDTSESLSQLLGLDDTLFTTPTLDFPIWSNTFQLGGFSPITAAPFTIYTASGSLAAVPEPPSVPLFLLGLGAVPILVFFGRMGDSRDARGRSRAKGTARA